MSSTERATYPCRIRRKTDRLARRELLDTFKRMRGCADCGTWTGRLHLDHLPNYIKSFSIGEDCMRTLASLIPEIAKCEVVCEICHPQRTWERRKEKSWEQ